MRWLAPRLLALHALALVIMAACVFMGLWQLGVYGSKHDDESAARRTAKPVDLLAVWGPDDAFSADLSGRPVWVRGTFTGQQFRVARPADAAETWIVAPLRVAGTRSALVIVRGVASPATPLPKLPKSAVSFRAVLQPGEDAPGTVDCHTHRLAALSIPALANLTHVDLFSGYALTSAAGVTGGLRPVAPPDPAVPWTVGLRNLVYALQWWIFGLFAAFMWWRMATDAVATDRSVDEARVA